MQTPEKRSPSVDGFRYDDGSVGASAGFSENPGSLVRATSWASDSRLPLHSARYHSTATLPEHTGNHSQVPAMGSHPVLGIWGCGFRVRGSAWLCLLRSFVRRFGAHSGQEISSHLGLLT